MSVHSAIWPRSKDGAGEVALPQQRLWQAEVLAPVPGGASEGDWGVAKSVPLPGGDNGDVMPPHDDVLQEIRDVDLGGTGHGGK